MENLGLFKKKKKLYCSNLKHFPQIRKGQTIIWINKSLVLNEAADDHCSLKLKINFHLFKLQNLRAFTVTGYQSWEFYKGAVLKPENVFQYLTHSITLRGKTK